MFAEVIGGILTKSLALLSDAGHMVSDAMSIALALVALRFAEREATVERTFGYQRLEALAAMANALTPWIVGAWVLLEAYHRVQDVPDVEGVGMLIVGVLGLLVNVLAAWVLHRSAKDSINVEGAFQHVMADLLGSVGVVISGIVILTTGWNMIDPILSVVIALLILRSAWPLTVKVFHVLVDSVPADIDVYRLGSDLEIEGVTLIHDIHVRAVSSEETTFSGHIMIDPEYEGDTNQLLRRLRDIIKGHGINHITIQVDKTMSPSGELGCEENHHVNYLAARSRVRT